MEKIPKMSILRLKIGPIIHNIFTYQKSNAVTSPTTSKFKQQSKSSTMQKGGVAECAEAFAKECKAPINVSLVSTPLSISNAVIM